MLMLGFASGVFAAVILLALTHIVRHFFSGSGIPDFDAPRVFGRTLTHREAHVIGVFLHTCVSGWFGALYAVSVNADVFLGGWMTLLGWGLMLSLFLGGVVLPLEGHGFFGVREDVWFPVDLFLTCVLWSVLCGWFLQLWNVVIL